MSEIVDPHTTSKAKSVGSICHWGPVRQRACRLIECKRTEELLCGVIAFNLFLMVAETDATVDDKEAPGFVVVLNFLLLGIYVVELACRIFVYRGFFIYDEWNILDGAIVSTDVILLFLDKAIDNMPRLSIFRMIRLIRLVRAFKGLSMFPELAMMLRGFYGAVKAIFWGMVLVMTILTVWSILAVKIIHPINLRVAANPLQLYGGCERCPRAFNTVFQACLTFFQTLVAGDSWGTVACPIIEEEPAAGLFFLAVLASVSLFIMNLIMAVIVESAMQVKSETLHELAMAKEKEFEGAAKEFLDMCVQLDTDGGGSLSKAELLGGFEHSEFANMMKVLGLERADMDLLFAVVDADSSGSVDYTEFMRVVFRMKQPDMHMLIWELAKIYQEVLKLEPMHAKVMLAATAQ